MSRLLLLAVLFASSTSHAQTTVPFVGCPSDGQTGPLEAPHGKAKAVKLPPAIAAKVAYYHDGQSSRGILAPRGWHCFSTYGSNGSSLFVAPRPLSSNDFFHDPAHLFTSPMIQVSTSLGDTSGVLKWRISSHVFSLLIANSQCVFSKNTFSLIVFLEAHSRTITFSIFQKIPSSTAPQRARGAKAQRPCWRRRTSPLQA